MRLYHVPGLSVAVFRDFQDLLGEGVRVRGRGGGHEGDRRDALPGGLGQQTGRRDGRARSSSRKASSRSTSDINAYLKGWKIPDNDLTKKTPVTLEMLLSHTGGLTVHGFPGYAADAKVPTVIEVLDGAAPANSPPIRVDLAPGHAVPVLGRRIHDRAARDDGRDGPVVSAAARGAGVEAARDDAEHLRPAASRDARSEGGRGLLRRRQARFPDKRHVYPEMAAAGLWTTPSDLARFGIGLQNILRRQARPASRRPWRERMTTAVRDGYGLGLAVADKDGAYFSHDGADEGFQTLFIAHKTKGYGVAIMANSDAGFKVMPELLRAIGAEYGWEGFPEAPVANDAADGRAAAAVAGRYKLGTDEVLVVTPKGDALECRVTFGEPFTLVPISPHRLRAPGRGHALHPVEQLGARRSGRRAGQGVSADDGQGARPVGGPRGRPRGRGDRRVPQAQGGESVRPGRGRAAFQQRRLSADHAEGLPEGDRDPPAEHGALSRVREHVRQPRRGVHGERRQGEGDRASTASRCR